MGGAGLNGISTFPVEMITNSDEIKMTPFWTILFLVVCSSAAHPKEQLNCENLEPKADTCILYAPPFLRGLDLNVVINLFAFSQIIDFKEQSQMNCNEMLFSFNI